ncbi:uroporphyrinogen-III C-methyltransferase [Psychromonas aquimarina]|uniref:uroporphyrinogen-III C-methyltransferase n=1 Tax=Psychromonas aquimarina TaxID=444919 RepID=UPI000424949D|nr:uroporphyrinogen-III C-methyltransferase [Psychromonas aquimarina]
MTDNKNNNEAVIETSSSGDENPPQLVEQAPEEKKSKGSKTAIFIGLLALVFSLSLTALGTYFYQQYQVLSKQQQAEIVELTGKLSSQADKQNKQTQAALKLKNQLEAQVEQVNQQLQKVKNENKLYSSDVQALQRSFSETTVRHPNDWILAEVEYLVKLAGRKIWLEKDTATAIALLFAADQRVVELSDASLSPLRSALLEDINRLEALPKRDPDGVVLALSSLERRIDKLVVAGLTIPEKNEDTQTDISSDINDWQENLTKSWDSFVESIVVINRRDRAVQALLSPQQSWYLRENLRNDLAKAEFAVYREQQKIYDTALHSASELLSGYYDLSDSNTSHFYKSIQRLSKRKITSDYPDQLKSAPLLDSIIKKRVKKSLASSRVE